MSKPVDISDYEIVFGVRTGVTVLLPKNPIFDVKNQNDISFKAAGKEYDVLVATPRGQIVLKGFKKDHLEESVNRGYIMFYEMEDEEVTRCTKAMLAAK